MTTPSIQIDVLADKAKRLPEERQLAIVEALREMLEEPYELSPEELAVLTPALAEIQDGIALIDAETDEILNKPWS